MQGGEPPASVREEYLRQAQSMNLDALTDPAATEKLSKRLWRLYDSQALELLAEIREDPREAENLDQRHRLSPVRDSPDQATGNDTKRKTSLRRRSKIALVTRHEDIRHAEGLMEACRILFEDQAQAKFDEYFAQGHDKVSTKDE